ncbi:hypothetical protein BC828DRAFT_401606 [Blastocladiella britannica]|nr:hypothetical protein BC828DRAFT_401606 [Blastocladiella britannica]
MAVRNATRVSRDLAVYLHYPYCRHRCSYCAFNVYKQPANVTVNTTTTTTTAYLRELRTALTRDPLTLLAAPYTGKIALPDYRVQSVYFGGGTPSLAPVSWVAACLDAIHKDGHVDSPCEVTLEANPSDVTRDKLLEWKKAGITRLSLGIQALDQPTLDLFERDHSVDLALRALDDAKAVFPGQVTADFIWARPGQSLRDWEAELARIMAIADNHLSLYQLTFERGTKLFRNFAESSSLPSHDLVADMYEATIAIAAKHGFQQYEVSSFGRHETRGRHNSAYWRGVDYVGVGPGAHGRISIMDEDGGIRGRVKTFRLRPPNQWEAACLGDSGHGLVKSTVMSRKEAAHELIVFGLRMPLQGIQFEPARLLSGVDPREFLDMDAVARFVDSGHLEYDSARLRCTPRGLAVVDELILHLVI